MFVLSCWALLPLGNASAQGWEKLIPIVVIIMAGKMGEEIPTQNLVLTLIPFETGIIASIRHVRMGQRRCVMTLGETAVYQC